MDVSNYWVCSPQDFSLQYAGGTKKFCKKGNVGYFLRLKKYEENVFTIHMWYLFSNKMETQSWVLFLLKLVPMRSISANTQMVNFSVS